MTTYKLSEVALAVRSENAGCTRRTVDIMLPNLEVYDAVKNAKWFGRETIANLYKFKPEQIELFECKAATGLKIVMPRRILNGNFGDTDVDGCSFGAPLLDMTVELKNPPPPRHHFMRED